ncbi:hypothetical protein ACFLYY_02085 [Patescibacteria group bacterium]
MKDVSQAKEIASIILNRNPEGIEYKPLLRSFFEKIPYKWKIPVIRRLSFGYEVNRMFLTVLKELEEEGRMRRENNLYYPK